MLIKIMFELITFAEGEWSTLLVWLQNLTYVMNLILFFFLLIISYNFNRRNKLNILIYLVFHKNNVISNTQTHTPTHEHPLYILNFVVLGTAQKRRLMDCNLHRISLSDIFKINIILSFFRILP